ncbi:MAG: tRNA-dihydrouridine synthase, partial [Desulforhabdus sp.]|nr:tRNA-dihydrouridine synthase [Desulforhabdus sp.]
KAKAAIKIPVIGNGDVSSPALATQMMKETECDAVMIGRAALGNPWLFAAVATQWGYQPSYGVPEDWADFTDSVSAHFENYLVEKRIPSGHCRQILIWYSKGLPESSRLRSKLYAQEQPEEMLHCFCAWVQELEARGLSFQINKNCNGANGSL